MLKPPTSPGQGACGGSSAAPGWSAPPRLPAHRVAAARPAADQAAELLATLALAHPYAAPFTGPVPYHPEESQG